MLDLSVLAVPGVKICVRCRDEKSTLAFLEEMFLQYPDRCEFWDRDENRWARRDSEYIDYYPYLNNVDGYGLCWDGGGYAERNGYTIIDYYDIPGALGEPMDFGEIVHSDIDINALF